jgi:hypothetical protein
MMLGPKKNSSLLTKFEQMPAAPCCPLLTTLLSTTLPCPEWGPSLLPPTPSKFCTSNRKPTTLSPTRSQ